MAGSLQQVNQTVMSGCCCSVSPFIFHSHLLVHVIINVHASVLCNRKLFHSDNTEHFLMCPSLLSPSAPPPSLLVLVSSSIISSESGSVFCFVLFSDRVCFFFRNLASNMQVIAGSLLMASRRAEPTLQGNRLLQICRRRSFFCCAVNIMTRCKQSTDSGFSLQREVAAQTAPVSIFQ